MTLLRAKHPRLRLDPEAYRKLRQVVLERDRWHCQNCGAMTGLEVHHLEPRGRLGDDNEQNLITLCWNCHHKIHQSSYRTLL
jgi:5-methylcytosine-specific restriction endonuclease McrA